MPETVAKTKSPKISFFEPDFAFSPNFLCASARYKFNLMLFENKYII